MNQMITLQVPASFKWVIDQMLKWKKEQKTGEFVINYKYGGIACIDKTETEFPPKEKMGRSI